MDCLADIRTNGRLLYSTDEISYQEIRDRQPYNPQKLQQVLL